MESWERHKSLLDAVFFTDNDIIRRKTKQHEDFWLFLEKYERFKSRKKQGAPSSLTEEDNKFDFPKTYNKRYKISFTISSESLKFRYKTYVSRYYDSSKDCKLSFDDILEFKQILLYYLDFLQKQKFSKLSKLKQDQNNLPIKEYEQNIIYSIKSNQVVIVAGDTGCGKSTQVPQYLLAAGYSKIACTQPRRIACISLAKRVSYETLNEFKSDIAYQVRFDTSKTKATKILFLTEGLLLRQFQSDPELSMYDVIVVDEVHERHMNGDFLLGVLKCLLQQRKDLKLILMSATINIELFTNYFDSAPVIQVPGRLYPIELQYLPHFVEKGDRSGGKSERLDPSPYLRVMQLIDKKYPSNERGDLLIFMSGMAEISAVAEAAREYALRTKSWIVLPLHSSLSIEEQDKIFDFPPEGVRKCIVSTNIAETSVTIDGVRFIADSGKVKEMTYDAQVKMQRLQEFWISQASAEQRKGRAGRTGPGVCFRLYSEEDYGAFSQYSTPEIHRVPLDTLVLQMASLGLRDATLFPFIEPPQKSNLVNAIHFLKDQNALTKDGELTSLGEMLAKLPVDICIGKMLIMGCLFSLVDPVLVIAAALSVQSPFTRKFGTYDDTEHRRQEYFSPHGDPFTLLAVYDEWVLVKSDNHRHSSSSKSSSSKKWCRRRGFEEQRFYEISKLKKQFEEILRDHHLLEKSQERSKNAAHEREERRRLVRMKRVHKQSSKRKRKMLKLESDFNVEGNSDENPDDSEDSDIDINDIDFKLRHNLSKLEATSKKNRRFTIRDVNLLKLIISSGLYPQIVLPDESNIYRKQTEQVYHSKDKQFLMLHPTSVYSLQADLLDSLYKTTDEKPGTNRRETEGRYITSKEFLAYVSLLETNKPYVVNTMKIPALQTLFLLSNSIDTNSDFTKIVFNEWIELSFDDSIGIDSNKDNENVQSLLSDVVKLRKSWETLLEQKLLLNEDTDDNGSTSVDLHFSRLDRIKKLEDEVSFRLAAFIDADVPYKMKRLTMADVKTMYVGYLLNTNIVEEDDYVENKPDNKTQKNGSDSSTPEHALNDNTGQTKSDNPYLLGLDEAISVPNKDKGGIMITPYLTYACLKDETSISVAAGEMDFLREHYHCPKCEEHLICTVIERLKHDEICGVKQLVEKASEIKKSDDDNRDEEENTDALANESSASSSRQTYFCNVCCENLRLTPIETLRHKKSHQ